MPENLTDVTSPGTTQKICLLLGLPIEIQIEIIGLLKCYWFLQPHPFKSLRLTCKHIEALCNPVFAGFISINASTQPALQLRKELAAKFAKHLKEMVLFISEQGEAIELSKHLEFVLIILERGVHLQKLSLYHGCTDTGAHSRLLSAISKLGALEEVRITEFEYSLDFPEYNDVQSTFHHRLLNHILDYHSQRLRLLAVPGMPMHEITFLKLRDTASQLRQLEFNLCITIETQGAFADPQRWACAGRLESLYIRYCDIHPATITRHIGAGVFGPLRIFHIVGCRGNSGDPPASAAIVWRIPPLNRVEVAQFNDLEMSRLGCIHAKQVWMRMPQSDRPLCVEAFRSSTTFPEAAELRVERDWDDKDFEELKRSCAMRGLTNVKRDLYVPRVRTRRLG